MSGKTPYRGNARFLELGTLGAPFRSLINVDHITNVRFEQSIGQQEAEYDKDGEMTAPPQQWSEGWKLIIVLAHGAGGQNIMFPTEAQAVGCYNTILDMIAGVGAPIARMPKLKVTPEPEPGSELGLLGPDGQPLGEMSPAEKDALAGNDAMLPGEVADLTDEEIDQLENPEIDIDAIAEAVEDGLGDDRKE
jgi:hypothetical protein